MTGFRSRVERFVAQFFIGLLAFTHIFVLLPIEETYAAPSTTLVINELQLAESGSGNATEEFIELYNKSGQDINVSGWKIVKYAASGATPSTLITFPSAPPTVINADDSLLVAHQDYSGGDVDFEYNAGSLANDNTIVLLNASSETVDLIRLGSATTPNGLSAEGDAVTNPQPNESINRDTTHSDTDNNSADFSIQSTPTPLSGKPNKPTLNPIQTDDESLTVSWTEVRNTNAYDIEYKLSSSDTYISDGDTTQTTKTVTNLENGQEYTVKVTAKNENGLSVPATQTGIPGLTVDAAITYMQNDMIGTHFGVGVVTALVDFEGSNIDAADVPSITFQRPNSQPVSGPLVYNEQSGKWVASLYVTKANPPTQDGTVGVTLGTNTPGKNIAITTGPSFTVDTVVSKPTATMMSRCSTAQDSFTTAQQDSDVDQIYIYSQAPTSQTNPIAVAPLTNGKSDEVFIGDNKVELLYLVAQDRTGNRSEPLQIINDISSPEPQLQLEGKNGIITATWPSIADATTYILRWRQVGQSDWQERVVTTTSNDIQAVNEKEYEVAVASRDAACNQSGFFTIKGIAHGPTVISASGRGGVADHEASIFAASQLTAEEKDGKGKEEKPKSPYSTEEDRDQNGIRDAEEDKNGNGIPDGEEQQPTPTPSPEEEDRGALEGLRNLFRDRSRLIITLAILLIIAGTALAAYSWYRGEDETPPSDDGGKGGPPSDETEESITPPTAEGKQKPKRGGKPKRKTRW